MHDYLTSRCSRRRSLHLLAASALAAGLPGIALAGAYDDFFKAVKLDNVSLVRSLLQRGFDPNTVEEERGETGLMIALREDANMCSNCCSARRTSTSTPAPATATAR